jgi:hypothetical protein|tara:strand:- start:272 stop:616 length:345 start_codon:yes stop_codon:yes gene_type:complete
MKKEEVNKKNTNTWRRMNDDSKKFNWRRKFIEKFGGSFKQISRLFVEWQEDTPKTEESPKERIISLINPQGDVVEIENFTKYCRENDLSRSALYEVLRGKRKQHKGYTAKLKGE